MVKFQALFIVINQQYHIGEDWCHKYEHIKWKYVWPLPTLQIIDQDPRIFTILLIPCQIQESPGLKEVWRIRVLDKYLDWVFGVGSRYPKCGYQIN